MSHTFLTCPVMLVRRVGPAGGPAISVFIGDCWAYMLLRASLRTSSERLMVFLTSTETDDPPPIITLVWSSDSLQHITESRILAMHVQWKVLHHKIKFNIEYIREAK